MGWGYGSYNNAGIPRLSSWFDAKKHFEGVIPIRGRAKECKPLGSNRRYTWYTVNKRTTSLLTDGDPLGQFVDVYGCQLYGNDQRAPSDPLTIEFYPNGEIHFNPVYACPTTMKFVNFTLAEYGSIQSYRGKWYWVNSNGQDCYPVQFADRFSHAGGLNRFRHVQDEKGKRLEPLVPMAEGKYVANRKVLNKLRKQYRPFTEYVNNSLLIAPEIQRLEVAEARHGLNFSEMGMIPAHWAGIETREKVHKNRAHFFKVMEKSIETQDFDMMYECMQYIGCLAGIYSYRRSTYICKPERFKDFFDEVLKYHFADTVFTLVEMPMGKPFKDENARYFNK